MRHVNSKEVKRFNDNDGDEKFSCLMITNNDTNMERTIHSIVVVDFFRSLFIVILLKTKLSHANQSADNKISLRLSISLLTALDVPKQNRQITIIVQLFQNRKKAHWYFFDHWKNWMDRKIEREKNEKKKSVSLCCWIFYTEQCNRLPSFYVCFDTFGLTASVHHVKETQRKE